MHSVVLKNDAVGDLVHSLSAINNITSSNKNEKVTIFLSQLSRKYSFLVQNPKVQIKILKHKLNLIEKIKLIYFLFNNHIENVYILAPKNFYFFLPIIFRKIKFFGLCVNGPNNYKRPAQYLRKYLYKRVVNDRSAIFKRDSTIYIQNKLTSEDNKNLNHFKFENNVEISDILKKYLPKEYIYFHVKKNIVDKLGWGISELKYLFFELLKHYDHVIFTKDIEKDSNSDIFNREFSMLDFSSKKFTKKNNNIIFFNNIEGKDLYNTIKYSSKILAFHGMMTNLGSIEKKSIIDLWFCNIKNWNDYRNYRNAFYEFKPRYSDYNFIIPNKNIKKTLKKMMFALKK